MPDVRLRYPGVIGSCHQIPRAGDLTVVYVRLWRRNGTEFGPIGETPGIRFGLTGTGGCQPTVIFI